MIPFGNADYRKEWRRSEKVNARIIFFKSPLLSP